MAAILFDIGGPILPEEELYEVLLGALKSALRDAGMSVTDDDYEAAVQASILSFVPSLTKAIAWRFTKPDAAKCLAIVNDGRDRFRQWSADAVRTPRPGLAALVESLAGKHTLALAANAGPGSAQTLEPSGMLRFFSSAEVSGDLGLHKPDPRFFLHILDKLRAPPEDTIMIGDRLDNDIVPAKALGMKAIRFRTGPYAILEPRTPDEIPDAEVTSVEELCRKLLALTRPT